MNVVTESHRRALFLAGCVLLVIVGCADLGLRALKYHFELNVAAAIATGHTAAVVPPLPSFDEIWALVLGMVGLSPAARGVSALHARATKPAAG